MVESEFGVFASLMLAAMNVPAVGGPIAGNTLRTHTVDDDKLTRVWRALRAIYAAIADPTVKGRFFVSESFGSGLYKMQELAGLATEDGHMKLTTVGSGPPRRLPAKREGPL